MFGMMVKDDVQEYSMMHWMVETADDGDRWFAVMLVHTGK